MSDNAIEASATSPPPARGSALSLALKGCVVALLAAATVFAVFVLVPDGNDYALATVLKHNRLASATGQRVVLVGGSNLAFGVDSTVVERRLGCPVVNMGMNGYVGVQYMLEEVRPHLRPDDIVVVALEYDSYFKSIKGTPADLLMIVKANPDALAYLDWGQRRDVAAAVPYVAQQKVLRLMREGFKYVWTGVLGQEHEVRDVRIDNIETLSGFTERGDLVSHLDVPWPYEREDGVNMSRVPQDPEVIPLLQKFTRDMQANRVTVLVSYTSVMRDYYERYRGKIEELNQALSAPPLRVPSPPTEFVYDEPLFFDTVYHLNAAGRALRSEKLASDILRQFNDAPPCGAQITSATYKTAAKEIR